MKKLLIFIVLIFISSDCKHLKSSKSKKKYKIDISTKDTTADIVKEEVQHFEKAELKKSVRVGIALDKSERDLVTSSGPIITSNKLQKPVVYSIKSNNVSVDTSKPTTSSNIGKVVYQVPDTMKVRHSYTIKVRIGFDKKEIHIEENLGTKIKESSIKISEKMTVELVDGSPDDQKSFTIVKENSDKQLIDSNDYTEWIFDVTPLRAGNKKLNLVISIIKGTDVKQKVYSDIITVKSDYVKEGLTFWEKYWQWSFSTLIIPFIIFLYKRRTEKKN